MPIAPNLNIALKEWATVCSALARGRQIILLRKGGIYESAGEFEVEHRQFLLIPTYLHQNAEMLKQEPEIKVEKLSAEPKTIHISLAAEITDIIPMPKRSAMEALYHEHIWTPQLIDMRFNYRPKNPLYLLLVRVSQLAKPVTIENTPAYAGCKSWVPLDRPIDSSNAGPVLNDSEFSRKREGILHQIFG